MTNFTPAQARELALKMGTGFGYTQDATDALHSLADQVETLTAERDALEPVAGAHPTKGTSALAAPVVPAHGAWAGTDEDGNVVCIGMNPSRRFDTPLYLQPAATPPQAAPVTQQSEPPEGWELVPKEFMRGFRTLAHNYSLTAEAPCYYHGVERDAFSSAYARCGQDLEKLRDMITAAPTAPKE